MTSSSTLTNTMLKIVVDTNQFLSVFVFRGVLMKLVFELVLKKKIELCISSALEEEVLEKLSFYGVNMQIQNEVMTFIKKEGMLVIPKVRVDICRDKEDNFLLELAETAHADYLVTRDKDLLDLLEWKETKIMKPEDFLPLLRKMEIL